MTHTHPMLTEEENRVYNRIMQDAERAYGRWDYHGADYYARQAADYANHCQLERSRPRCPCCGQKMQKGAR